MIPIYSICILQKNKTEYGDNMKSLIGGLEHEFYDFPFILGIS